MGNFLENSCLPLLRRADDGLDGHSVNPLLVKTQTPPLTSYHLCTTNISSHPLAPPTSRSSLSIRFKLPSRHYRCQAVRFHRKLPKLITRGQSRPSMPLFQGIHWFQSSVRAKHVSFTRFVWERRSCTLSLQFPAFMLTPGKKVILVIYRFNRIKIYKNQIVAWTLSR